jgi:hypothetical protein
MVGQFDCGAHISIATCNVDDKPPLSDEDPAAGEFGRKGGKVGRHAR